MLDGVLYVEDAVWMRMRDVTEMRPWSTVPGNVTALRRRCCDEWVCGGKSERERKRKRKREGGRGREREEEREGEGEGEGVREQEPNRRLPRRLAEEEEEEVGNARDDDVVVGKNSFYIIKFS